PVLLSIVALVGLVWLLRRRTWRPLLLGLGAWSGAALLSDWVKALVDRPRPPAAHMLVHVTNSSFPSGHVTDSTAVYGMLAALLAGASQSWPRRVGWWACALIVWVVIGVSRLYLRVHWLTEVLGGYALGGLG